MVRFLRGLAAPLALLACLSASARAQDLAEPTPPVDAVAAEGDVSVEVPASAPDVAEPAAPAADPDEDPAEAAREELRAARLGELSARTRAALTVARPLARASGDVTRIERVLPRTEADIRRLSHPARLARIPHLSQRELADLRRDWRRHGSRLEDWQTTIAERSAEIEEARTALVELKRTWSGLRDLSDRAGRPEPRHARIQAGLEETRRGLAELEASRDALALLSDRVSDLQIVVEEVADQLRDAASVYRERLAVRDAPPIHLGLAAQDASDASVAPSVVEQARQSLVDRAETPDELLAELLPAGVALVAAFVLLYGVLLRLGRGRDVEGRREAIGELATEVLRSPVSSAALLALLGASVVIAHAPILVYDLLFFATLGPLFRALPPLSPPALRPLVRGAIVFVAIDRVQGMLAEGSAVLRLALLVEGALVLGASAAWMRAHAAGASMWARALVLVASTVLLAAVLANLAGYLFLATVLTRGAGFSAYVGLALAGGVAVVEAIVDLLVVSPTGQRLRSLREHALLVHTRTLRFLVVAAALVWAMASLEGFGVWGSISTAVRKVLRDEHEIGSLDITLGAILGALAILAVTGFVLRLTRFVLELDVLPRLALEPGVDGAVSGLTRYVLGGTGLLLALAYLGIDASQIALVAGALGVGIGFGLQGIVANFIAGIVLMLERPVRLGDFIEVGSLVGSVDRIGLRSSTVKALDGAEVIVPNESLISREVVNWTLSDRKRRVEVKVGVAYGTDPHRVVDILRKVALEHRDPSVGLDPEVLFDAFGESSLDFTLQFWARSFAHSIALKSEVGLAVHDALAAAGIEIPFPQRDVHIKGGPAPKP